MDLLNDEVGSSSEACVTSAVDGNEVTGKEAERALDMTEEVDNKPTTVPVIKTEPNVSCAPVVSVTHISYRLYPELAALVKQKFDTTDFI
jgi:hypothetical protein